MRDRSIVAKHDRIARAARHAIDTRGKRVRRARHIRRASHAHHCERLHSLAQPFRQIDSQSAVAEQNIIPSAATKGIGPTTAGEPVGAARADQCVVAAAAIEDDGVGNRAGIKDIIPPVCEPTRIARKVGGR